MNQHSTYDVNPASLEESSIGIERIVPANNPKALIRQIEELERGAEEVAAISQAFMSLYPTCGGSRYPYGRGVHWQNLLGSSRFIFRLLFDRRYREVCSHGDSKVDREDVAFAAILGPFADTLHLIGFIIDQPRYWYKRMRHDPKQSALELCGHITNKASTPDEARLLEDAVSESLRSRTAMLQNSANLLRQILKDLFPQDYKAWTEPAEQNAPSAASEPDSRDPALLAWSRSLLASEVVVDSFTSLRLLPPDKVDSIIKILRRVSHKLEHGGLPSLIDAILVPLDHFFLINLKDQPPEIRRAALDELIKAMQAIVDAHREAEQAFGNLEHDLAELSMPSRSDPTIQEVRAAQAELQARA